MNDREKSDSPVVPGKPPNKKAATAVCAEVVEERGLAKGNPSEADMLRTQGREHRMPSGLARIPPVSG